jgi:hypothetical protein
MNARFARFGKLPLKTPLLAAADIAEHGFNGRRGNMQND